MGGEEGISWRSGKNEVGLMGITVIFLVVEDYISSGCLCVLVFVGAKQSKKRNQLEPWSMLWMLILNSMWLLPLFPATLGSCRFNFRKRSNGRICCLS